MELWSPNWERRPTLNMTAWKLPGVKVARASEERVYVMLLHKRHLKLFRRSPIPKAGARCAICWSVYPVTGFFPVGRPDYAAGGAVLLTK